jgi:ribosomal protein S27AE
MAEAAVNGFRVTCPQCGAFVMKFAGTDLKAEVNCGRCHATVMLEKTLESVSVVAIRTKKKAE